MIIITALALVVAAYFIYEKYKSSKIIRGLQSTIEQMIDRNDTK